MHAREHRAEQQGQVYRRIICTTCRKQFSPMHLMRHHDSSILRLSRHVAHWACSSDLAAGGAVPPRVNTGYGSLRGVTVAQDTDMVI